MDRPFLYRLIAPSDEYERYSVRRVARETLAWCVIAGLAFTGAHYLLTEPISPAIVPVAAVVGLVFWPWSFVYFFRPSAFVEQHYEQVCADCTEFGKRPAKIVNAVRERIETMVSESAFLTASIANPSATGRRTTPRRFYLNLLVLMPRPTLYEKLWHEVDHHCDALQRIHRGEADVMELELSGALRADPAFVEEIEQTVRRHTPPTGRASELFRWLEDTLASDSAAVTRVARGELPVGVALGPAIRVSLLAAALIAYAMVIQWLDGQR